MPRDHKFERRVTTSAEREAHKAFRVVEAEKDMTDCERAQKAFHALGLKANGRSGSALRPSGRISIADEILLPGASPYEQPMMVGAATVFVVRNIAKASSITATLWDRTFEDNN